MKLSFETKAKLGYAILALLLAGGLALSIRRLTALADAQIVHIRAEEHDITLVERLRWNSELIVSLGRAYLISADASRLARVREAEALFDGTLARLRERGARSAASTMLVGDVARKAEVFRRVQERLLTAREGPRAPESIARRFETELQPPRADLRQSVDLLVSETEVALTKIYVEAHHDRRRLEGRLFGLLGVLMVISVGVAWSFAALLGKSYRQEETALEAARKAVSARDELLGIVAHDLRNPLGAITMKAALMRKKATSDKARDEAESIQRVAARMEYLIKSLLDVTTMEAGQFSITRAPCDADDLLQELRDLFSNLAGSKRIRLQAEARDHGLVLDADRDRVVQVLSNLIGNALRFTPPDGEVKVSIERQRDLARFTVSDTGPGIAEHDFPRLFDRFWKREAAGIGLGLFIVKGIVDAHGGRIWVESQPGHGATFLFELPLASDASVARAPVDAAKAPAHP